MGDNLNIERNNMFKRHKIITLCFGLFIIFLVLFIILELTLKYVVGLGDPVLYRSYPLYGYRLLPDQELKRFHGSAINVNNLGLRADVDWDNNIENKILFLGDSVTYGGSYISNDELFSSLAIKYVNGYVSGNGGNNGWGVSNIYGLIMDYKFLPAKIYVTVVPETDFYRGLTRLEGQPIWCKKPEFAFQEVFDYLLFKEGIKKYINWESTSSEDDIKRVVEQAVIKLRDMDSFLQSRGYKHLIYISPSREQVLETNNKDELVSDLVRTYNINVIYILDRINSLNLNQEEKEKLFYDYIHLNKKGHELWAAVIGKDLSKLTGN